MRKSALTATNDTPDHIRSTPLNPQHSNDYATLATRLPPTLAPAVDPCLP